MGHGAFGGTTLILGLVMALASPSVASASHSKSPAKPIATAHIAAKSSAPVHQIASGHQIAPGHQISSGGHSSLLHNAVFHSLGRKSLAKGGKERIYSHGYSGISCVPYARSVSGIELKGNAAEWWDAATGVYARGDQPEAGSVLNFRSTGSMRLGHVAVVSQVINSREVQIDHANWGGNKGGISRGIPVIDVSERNDWSAVRVAMGRTGDFGSVYPTYGFIYDRPDNGTIMASHNRSSNFDEVAEAPARAFR